MPREPPCTFGGEAEAEVPQDEQPQEFARANRGGMAYDGRTGELRPASHVQAHVNGADLNVGSGILATARSKLGGPARELTPETIVEHGGMELTLREAEYAGLVKRNDGRYVETSADEQAQALEPQADKAHGEGAISDMNVELFPEETEAALAEAVGDVPGNVLVPVVARYGLQFAETGTLAPNVEQVMSDTGLSRENAERFMNAAAQAFIAQANDALAKFGIDAGEFSEWCREERPRAFKAAVQNQIHARTTAGYRALAQEFLKHTPPSAEALNQAGYPTMVHPNTGELLVKIEGEGWQSAKAAARSGRI